MGRCSGSCQGGAGFLLGFGGCSSHPGLCKQELNHDPGNTRVHKSSTNNPSELPGVWAVPQPQKRCCRTGISQCLGSRQAQLSSSLAKSVQEPAVSLQSWGSPSHCPQMCQDGSGGTMGTIPTSAQGQPRAEQEQQWEALVLPRSRQGSSPLLPQTRPRGTGSSD